MLMLFLLGTNDLRRSVAPALALNADADATETAVLNERIWVLL
jgi:hypothetical protein